MATPRKLENWLSSYLNYTSKQESPEKLHFWTGLSVLSSALKRQVWMDLSFYKLYPNIYVLLVAESAKSRKSISMDTGINLIRDAVPDLYYISGSLTPEGLLKHMNRVKVIGTVNTNGNQKKTISYDSHVFIHADELAELFGFDSTRASKLTILLTKIYGAQKEHTHTLASEGQLLLRNLYPTFLGGTDPHNLKVLPDEAVAGLLGRMIFVATSEKRQAIAWPVRDVESDDLYKLLKYDLHTISQLRGECKVSKRAHDFFETWYVNRSNTKVEDPRIDAFYERCHDTARKISILFSIAESNELCVHARHMVRAIDCIEAQVPEFVRVTSWLGTSNFSQQKAKFLDALRRQKDRGTRKQMLGLLNISLEDIISIEETLEQEGTVGLKLSGKTMLYTLTKESGK